MLSIGVPFLASLLSLEAAVKAATNRARVWQSRILGILCGEDQNGNHDREKGAAEEIPGYRT